MSTAEHPFTLNPHRTLFALALPVLISLIAEPLTGLVDTFFIARLGAGSLAALGVAAALLSSVFWLFNFLGIGTQTEVARLQGSGERARAAEASGTAILLALLIGTGLALACWPWLDTAAGWMGADAEIAAGTVTYLKLRLLGAPATLVMFAAFGALRGLQDMRTPLRIALASNALNVLLDAILIFGWGPVPALGIAGAAWASTASQWLAGVWAAAAARRRLGPARQLHWEQTRRLLRVGGDLVVRTGSLLLFLVLATRVATRAGASAGAAHQVVRQVWLLSALALDALAVSAQSLIGFFSGAGDVVRARRVAAVICRWGLATGAGLALIMLGLTSAARIWLVPASAHVLFVAAWQVAALSQPLAALSFVTDGIHWGMADYRYLRNGMLAATGLGSLALLSIDVEAAHALTQVWVATAGWLALRMAFGLARIWPGLGGPLKRGATRTAPLG